MTEKRLIDANGCAKYIVGRMGFNPASAEQVLEYMAEYFEQNAVDAVEVVRCKDCKHWHEPWLKGQCFGKCLIGKTMLTEPNHFCSYGERRYGE